MSNNPMNNICTIVSWIFSCVQLYHKYHLEIFFESTIEETISIEYKNTYEEWEEKKTYRDWCMSSAYTIIDLFCI